MKNWIDITTVTPRITPKSHQSADMVFKTDGFKSEQDKFISANFTREQYLNAEGMVRSISEKTQVNLDVMDFLGKTNEEIQARFDEKCGNRNKRAGVRALVSKYGHESAERIVKKHSGRTIQ